MPFVCIDHHPWQPKVCHPQQLPDRWRSWLLDRGSLTRRLQSCWPGTFQVELLKQSWELPSASERQVLGIPERQLANIREVILHAGGQPRVFARTIIPRQTLQGANRKLLKLGTQPLGELLFSYADTYRAPIEVAQLSAAQFNSYLSYQYQDEKAWGRRSLFFLRERPLIVCEIFLPQPVELFGNTADGT